MRLYSISSGSSGNSIYIGSETTNILVDAGISGKKIEKGLGDIDISPTELDAILITHEHIDHIKGLGVIARRYGIPIYSTKGTIEAIKSNSSVGEIDRDLLNVICYDTSYLIGDVKINPIKISHDAAEPVAYRFEHNEKRAAVMTDLGMYDDYIIDNLKNLDVLFLEANHDVRMLQMGRYPYQLKQRILGKYGHLSNESSGKLLSNVLHDNMKKIVLSHLSHDNNMPELAYEAVRMEVTMSDTKYDGKDFDITVAKRDIPSNLIAI